MPYRPGAVVHNPSVRKLCPRKYPGHPRGCPNYGKRAACPPRAPLLMDIQDIGSPTVIIWNRYEFGEHVARMKAKHPKWSDRQLACCLYWQGTARKALGETIEGFKSIYTAYTVTRCPEAMGVDITATMAKLGIELEWPPERYTYQVAVGFVWIKETEDER